MIDFRTKFIQYLGIWDHAQNVMDNFNPHYSVQPYQARELFDGAMTLKPGDIIVELGVCHGRTSAMFATTCQVTDAVYYGVDFFGLEGSKAAIDEKFTENGLKGTIIEGNTHKIGSMWSKYRHMIAGVMPPTDHEPGLDEIQFGDDGISLLFIDAGHDEANVKPDLEIWLPLMAPGGLLFMHDCDDPYDPASPHWAVRHYGTLHTEGWARKFAHGMLIARKPL